MIRDRINPQQVDQYRTNRQQIDEIIRDSTNEASSIQEMPMML